MDVLGVNAAFHDSSACLVRDGRIIAAAEEERFNRIKHGKRPVPFSAWELPFGAIDYCLEAGRISLADVDVVAYSFDPAGLARAAEAAEFPLEPGARPTPPGFATPWEPLLARYVVNAPRQLAHGAPHHLAERFAGIDPDSPPYRFEFVNHHRAHAASAFFPSPYSHAAVMCVDGRGEADTTSYWLGNRDELRRIGGVEMPHSLGLLYERFTSHLGFLHSSDEYKVMALASYGHGTSAQEIRDLIDVGDDGTYTVHDFAIEEAFGPARRRGEPFRQRHFDLAASLQLALEDVLLSLASWLREESGERNLCMAGGVALNCVTNSRIRDAGLFEHVWVQPAAGDAGTALGAALACSGADAGRETMTHAFLGPEFSDAQIADLVEWSKLPYQRSSNVAADAARLLADGRIVGWFQGRMEFGPRALGARSILASPIPPDMKRRLNDLKDREDFRPVAPAVLEEDAHVWFDACEPSPFMLFVDGVREETADFIPAVRHVDGSARIQTVNAAQHPRYHALLREFKQLTGVPVLVNTSFTTRGEPVVCTPRDALECFWTSPLDDLVIGSYILHKTPVKIRLRDARELGVGSSGEVARTDAGGVVERV
jgi:carbamoyltransferase